MKREMKIWNEIRNHLWTHGLSSAPFVWTYHDAVLDLTNSRLSSADFEFCVEWQRFNFLRGGMQDVVNFCERHQIDTHPSKTKPKTVSVDRV